MPKGERKPYLPACKEKSLAIKKSYSYSFMFDNLS